MLLWDKYLAVWEEPKPVIPGGCLQWVTEDISKLPLLELHISFQHCGGKFDFSQEVVGFK